MIICEQCEYYYVCADKQANNGCLGKCPNFKKEQYERPQGEWIEYNTACHHYKCDQCNADYNSFMVKPNFCPNCGADMRNNESAN